MVFEVVTSLAEGMKLVVVVVVVVVIVVVSAPATAAEGYSHHCSSSSFKTPLEYCLGMHRLQTGKSADLLLKH
jgi:hypothetical protein